MKKNACKTDEIIDETLYGEVLSKQEVEESESSQGIRAQEPYHYFKIDKMKAALKLTAKTQREGRNILDHGNLAMTGVSRGYLDNMSNTPVCSFQFRGKEKRYGSPSPVHVRLLIGRSMVQSAQCDCYTCSTKYYWSGEKNCPFISAALDLVSDYHSQNNDVMDATNFAGMQVINSFADRKRSQIITESRRQESSLILEPRLVCKEGYISLSFKIGEAKLFVVKDLVHFADLVQKSETEVYGSNTTINHGIQNFTKDSRKWVEFIRDCVAEENRLFRSIAEITWRNVKKRVSDLELYGWRIDRLYELVGSDGIRFEDRDSKKNAC